MKIEKGIISSNQLMYLIAGFILSSGTLLSFVQPIAKNDTWIAIILGYGIGFIFVFTYTTLANFFPGKNIVEVLELTYGKFIGNILALAYIWFFLSLCSLNTTHISGFFVNLIMPETPMLAFLIPFLFVCAVAVKKGIEVMARCVVLLLIIMVVELIITILLLIRNIHISNFLPVLDIPLKNLFQGSHIISAIPIGESISFLTIIPYVNNKDQINRSMFLGLLLSMLCFLGIELRITGVLGITAPVEAYPNYQSVRLINIGGIITRMEILNVIILLSTIFIKVIIFLYATSLCIAQLFKLRVYSQLPFAIAGLVICLNIAILDYNFNINNFAENIYPIYSLPFEFIIPLITLIIAKTRKSLGRMGEEI